MAEKIGNHFFVKNVKSAVLFISSIKSCLHKFKYTFFRYSFFFFYEVNSF